jgi:hypothetical protein
MICFWAVNLVTITLVFFGAIFDKWLEIFTQAFASSSFAQEVGPIPILLQLGVPKIIAPNKDTYFRCSNELYLPEINTAPSQRFNTSQTKVKESTIVVVSIKPCHRLNKSKINERARELYRLNKQKKT